jgi:hypothetical protein
LWFSSFQLWSIIRWNRWKWFRNRKTFWTVNLNNEFEQWKESANQECQITCSSVLSIIGWSRQCRRWI